MRIGVDVRALADGRTTGVQVYIVNLLQALFDVDRENEYVLFANSLKKIELERFDYPNVSYKITNYPNKIFNFLQRIFSHPKIDRITGGVDIFFSPHWRVLALNTNVPLVVTFHDLSYEVLPEFFTRKQRLWHKWMGYRGAARKADRIIAVSQSTKNDLMDIYQIPDKKVAVIYSGVTGAPASRHLDLPEKYFLCFGTFEPRKNLHNLIEAHRKYLKQSTERIPLVLAGSRGWKTKLTQRDRVFVYQDISDRDKAELYQNAYAFVFLSFYEGFGFPILEAASYGVPVISGFATSMPEVGRGFALFVNPFRPNQVAEAMLELERHPDLREDLSRRAKAAADKFSWRRTAEETLDLFQSVMADKTDITDKSYKKTI